MLSVEDARARVLALMPDPQPEAVALTDAAGRVLLQSARAARAQPPFAASAMDGYAVRAAEAQLGARLTLAGEAPAGRAFAAPLPAGGAVRIFTGAPVPKGADAILIQEDAEREGDSVIIREAPTVGAHIRPAGGDFEHDAELAAPLRLTPRAIGLLAAMNAATLTVARRPIVALIPTGDELVHPGERPGPDQIIASSALALAARVAQAGGIPRLCPIARDNAASLLTALEAARGADIVITLGGASVGDHDLVAQVFGSAGLALDFYKVRMRPGKPLMAGRIAPAPGETGPGPAMLGLPGNPVSAMVCGELFLVPAIARCLGLGDLAPPQYLGILAHDLEENGPREHYMRANREALPDGRVALTVAARQDSSLQSVLARADTLVVRAPKAPALPAGSQVAYVPLDWLP
ncbi:MAG: molybdopterin molybdotransferase MoeA [Pseudomonadota bacterium]